jgi:DNA-binding Lrp family transcriptional regulator
MGGKGSGATDKDIDLNALVDLLDRGATPAESADFLGVSLPTVKNRIRRLQESQGLILEYRGLQNLHLTELQLRCIEAITPAKINEASLNDLARAFKIFKEAELEIRDNSKMSGLLGHLIELERQQLLSRGVDPEKVGAGGDEDVQDAEVLYLPGLTSEEKELSKSLNSVGEVVPLRKGEGPSL